MLAMADDLGGKQGLDRCRFFQTAPGMAAALVAMNEAYGPLFEVTKAEAATPAMAEERANSFNALVRRGRDPDPSPANFEEIILDAGLRPELTFTSFGRHGGTIGASASGLTETQLTQKGQWSSTAAMAHYLHDDDEAKQDAQMKRIRRWARQSKQAKRK